MEKVDNFDLVGNDTHFKAARKILLRGIIDALTSRFSDKDAGIIKATSILNFAGWPETETDGAFKDLLSYTIIS